MVVRKFIMVLSLACAVSLCADTNTIQYVDDFEAYAPGTVLYDTNHWYGSTNAVMVQTNVHASGSTRSAIIPSRAALSNSFSAAYSTNLWMGMDVVVDYYDDSIDNPPVWTDGNAQLYVSTSGYFVVYNAGYGWQVLSNDVHGVAVDPVPSNDWVRVDVRMDYAQRQWRLDVNGRVLATGLHFIATGPELFSGLEVYSGANSTSYLDNVYLYDTDAMPRMTAVPNAFTNNIILGYTVPTQFLDLVSAGDGEIDYQIEVEHGSPWLELSSVGGSLTNNMTNQVWVTYLTNSLSSGVNSDVLRFVSSDWGGMTQEVAVTLNVMDYSLTPSALSNSIPAGSLADAQEFDIIKTGSGAFDYDITISGGAWLDASPDSGTLTDAETHTIAISYDTAALAPGHYTATVEVATTDHGGVTQTVDVALTVFGAPAQLVFEVEPADTIAGETITPSVTVRVLDSLGQLVENATTPVTLSIQNNPSSGTLSGTLTRAAVGGIATFNDLWINRAGVGYTLQSAATGLIVDESDA
ncbi:MAG: hypothetical protein LC725_08315, partial [Lentisphaerae bacterium]|nr:hypothetical protein [Lentisphaerota bacterium]